MSRQMDGSHILRLVAAFGLSACATLPPHNNGLKGKLNCSDCATDKPMAIGTKRWVEIGHFVRDYFGGFAQAILPICSNGAAPIEDDLHGPADVVSENPQVASVEQVRRTKTAVFALISARAAGRTELRATAGHYHDRFPFIVAQANSVRIECQDFDDLKTTNQAVGLVVGQRVICEIKASNGADGLFVDVDPDPHLGVEKLLSGEHKLRLEGLRSGGARLRVHSGTSTIDIPIAVVADDEADTSSLLVGEKEVAPGGSIALSLRFPPFKFIAARVKTADGRIARLPQPRWRIEDPRVARLESLERDIPTGLFRLTAVKPGSTRLLWESGRFRGEWVVGVSDGDSPSARSQGE